ncbi:MAG: ABC transporter ATP-binding protein [Planctomycetaceae bacterium]|nr:ABC transporter ATP-binding protein [Planctomycetaceae bacterium]
MNDFREAIRLSLRYKWSIIGAALSSLMIALLFGASIATTLPFVKIIFTEDSNTIELWVEQQLITAEARVAEVEASFPAIDDSSNTNPWNTDPSWLEAQQTMIFYQWLQGCVAGRVPTTPFGTLQLVIVWLLFASLLKGVFLVISVVLVAKVANRTVMDMRRIYFRRAMEMDSRRVEQLGTSVLMNHLSNSLQMVSAALMALYGRALREPMKMLTCLVGAAFISLPLLILSLILLPFCGLLVYGLSQRMKRAVNREIGGMSAVYQTLMETFNGLKTIRIFNREQTERVRFKRNSKTLYRISLRISLYDSLIRPATEMAGIASFSIAVLAGGYLVLNQETHLLWIPISSQPLSAEQVVLFFVFLAGASDPARKMSEIVNVVVRGGQACSLLRTTFDQPPTIAAPANPRPVVPHHQSISLRNLRFAYQANTPVLKGVTLEIPFGQTVAIVGGNGCGKSTLIYLLTRFYDPHHGQVLIDGIDVREYDPRQLRQQFAWVTQDASLFQGTIRENIAYGKLGATELEIQAAAKLAGVTDFLPRVAQGLETQVGDMGRELSAGQRQRVALARAVLADPKILILDEATSQMDGYNEQLIHQRLKPFFENRTTIIISHRRSSLELVDRIVVMDAGRVVEDGTLDDLQQHSISFTDLFQTETTKAA